MAEVIPFEPRPPRVPALTGVEVRLVDEGTAIEMSLRDDTGNVVAVILFGLSAKQPVDFDLARLKAAWDEWRGRSEFAS